MKFILLLLSIVFYNSKIDAQTLNVKHEHSLKRSQIYPVEYTHSFTGLNGESIIIEESNLVSDLVNGPLIYSNPRVYIIDNKGDIKSEFDLKSLDGFEKVKVNGIHKVNQNQLAVFFERKNKTNKQNQFFFRKIDLNGFTPTGEETFIDEVPLKTKRGYLGVEINSENHLFFQCIYPISKSESAVRNIAINKNTFEVNKQIYSRMQPKAHYYTVTKGAYVSEKGKDIYDFYIHQNPPKISKAYISISRNGKNNVQEIDFKYDLLQAKFVGEFSGKVILKLGINIDHKEFKYSNPNYYHYGPQVAVLFNHGVVGFVNAEIDSNNEIIFKSLSIYSDKTFQNIQYDKGIERIDENLKDLIDQTKRGIYWLGGTTINNEDGSKTFVSNSSRATIFTKYNKDGELEKETYLYKSTSGYLNPSHLSWYNQYEKKGDKLYILHSHIIPNSPETPMGISLTEVDLSKVFKEVSFKMSKDAFKEIKLEMNYKKFHKNPLFRASVIHLNDNLIVIPCVNNGNADLLVIGVKN